MHFHYNEPLEFISALAMAGKKDHMMEFARELRIAPDEHVFGLVDGSISRLSAHMKRELACFFGQSMYYERLDGLLFRICYEAKELRTAQEWLDVYREQSPAALTGWFIDAVYASAGVQWRGEFELSQAMEEWDRLERLVAASPLADRDIQLELLEYVRFPEEFKLRTMHLLEAFHQYGFEPMREELRSHGEAGAARYERLFAADPEAAFRAIARADPSLVTKRTKVHISYISQIRADMHRIADPALPDWMVLGAGNDQLDQQREEKETVEKFLKVIADKRRLDMIEMLKERRHYAGELAQLMGLTPAAIHYHTNLLLDLDLIRITKADSRIYYELDLARLEAMMEQTRRMLLR